MLDASENATVRETTLSLLRSLGIDTIFGNPGSTELSLYRDFPDGMRYVLGLQESVVLAMADGYAQAQRNAAFVNLHSAAGLGHALGNLFTAFRNQTPLIVTAGQQARSMLPFDPFLYAERATEFPRPYVKWACEPARAEDVPNAIAQAYYIAMQAPQGPTFVSVPSDDWDRRCEPVSPRRVSRSIEGDTELLALAAKALADAERPALVVGAGIARDDAWQEAIELAERHQAAVWVSPTCSRNSFPELHPLLAGFLMPGRESIVKSLSPYDLVLVLGGPLSLYHVEGSGPHIRAGTEVWQLVDDPRQAAWAPDGTSIVTSLKSGIASLLRGPAPRARAPQSVKKNKASLDKSILTDAFLMHRIDALRPTGSVIVDEAPSSRGALRDHLPINEKDGYYKNSSGGLGYGLPASIGIALGRPGERVVAILGDGAAMYAIQGLWSAAQIGLPISFIIVNNRRYEALVQIGPQYGLKEVIGSDLPNIGFAELAKGQGVQAKVVKDIDDLDIALAWSFSSDFPTLVEVYVK